MYDDDEEQEEGPKSSFTTYLAEGDVLFKQGEYKKALDSYNLVRISGSNFESYFCFKQLILGKNVSSMKILDTMCS
jgi:hypothetical protein